MNTDEDAKKKVLTLAPLNNEPDPVVIYGIREWLAQAKRGELKGAILLAELQNGNTVRRVVGSISNETTVFICEMAKQHALNDSFEHVKWLDDEELDDEEDEEPTPKALEHEDTQDE